MKRVEDSGQYRRFKEDVDAIRAMINNGTHSTDKFQQIRPGQYPGTRLIWNVPADNVMMMINHNGKIFMRPNSKYFDALSGGREVIPHNGLNEFRRCFRNSNRLAWFKQYYREINRNLFLACDNSVTLNLGKKEDLRRELFIDFYEQSSYNVARYGGDADKVKRFRSAMGDYYNTHQLGPRQLVTISI